MKKMIRKLAALALALVMVLGCAAASATTVDVSLKVDSENAKTALGSLGMPEEQQAGLDAVAKLLSALGVKVTALTDGAEIALSLNGTEAVKAGFASVEGGAAVVSTVIPSYILTIKGETLQKLLQQALSSIPGIGALIGGPAAAAGGSIAMPENLNTYIQNLVTAVMGAMVPGTPEQGEFVFENVTFDTKAPLDIDMPKMRENLKSAFDTMFEDKEVLSLIGTFSGAAGAEAPSAEALSKSVSDALDKLPDTVSTVYYSNTAKPGEFYLTGEAAFEGKEVPACTFNVLNAGGDVKIALTLPEQKLEITAVIVPNRLTVRFQAGDKLYVILDGSAEMGEEQIFTVSLCVNSESPLCTAVVKIGQNGERTLPVEKEGKTELTIEDMMTGEPLPQEFQTELYQSLFQLMANPEIAALITSFTTTTVTVETPVNTDGE